jgi:hypothetical protein
MDNQNSEGQGKMRTGKTCNCPHHKVLPILTILVGADFLLGALGIFTWWFVDIIWPILLIIAGFTWMNAGKCGCCDR